MFLARLGKAIASVILLGSPACVARPPGGPGEAPPGEHVRLDVSGTIERVPLEDYVRVTILSELAPAGEDAATAAGMFEVQAIVSRTYALTRRHAGSNFDLCSTTHCQRYEPSRVTTSSWAGTASQAVRKTRGLILRYAGAPARVVFHADCGGHTSAARDVWSGDGPPYLAAVADEGPAASAHSRWRFAPAMPALVAALNADERTRVGARLQRIDVIKRDEASRALVVALDGEQSPIVRGEELRTVLSRAFGVRAFRSTRFDVVRTASGFEFTGRGFGHGGGLCQAGALARLRAGASPSEVLSVYFPGTSLR